MIRVAVLTVSDSAAAGRREDQSGPALVARCSELGWPVAAARTVLDDRGSIAAALAEWLKGNTASVILTTGGTGVSARDVTPEATRAIIEREIPGISELMRMKGMEETKFSVLSRAVAGTAGSTLIINLPGSPRGAVSSLRYVEHLIPHLVDLLSGRTEHGT